MSPIKRWSLGAALFFVVMFSGWYSGVDLFSRSKEAATVLLAALVLGGAAILIFSEENQ